MNGSSSKVSIKLGQICYVSLAAVLIAIYENAQKVVSVR